MSILTDMPPTAHIYRVKGPKIGHGHAVRCKAIGDALAQHGWNIVVHEPLTLQWAMPGDINIIDFEATPAEVLALRNLAPVINLYDKGPAKWYANLSILHTTHLDSERPDDAPEHHIIAGLQYAILRPEFAKARKERTPPAFPPRKIFVAHGGSDPTNHTQLTLNALGKIQGASWSVDVVLGSDFNHHLYAVKYHRPKFKILRDISAEEMAKLMTEADLGICSMGITTLEACCVGLPTINVCPTKYHASVASTLQAKGLILCYGYPDPEWLEKSVDDPTWLRLEIQAAAANKFQLRLTSRNALAYVTGQGARHTAQIITDRFWER